MNSTAPARWTASPKPVLSVRSTCLQSESRREKRRIKGRDAATDPALHLRRSLPGAAVGRDGPLPPRRTRAVAAATADAHRLAGGERADTPLRPVESDRCTTHITGTLPAASPAE